MKADQISMGRVVEKKSMAWPGESETDQPLSNHTDGRERQMPVALPELATQGKRSRETNENLR